MNRIASTIPTNRIKFSKALAAFDYTMLQNPAYDCELVEDSYIIERYVYWVKHQHLFNFDSDNHAKQEDLYAYKRIREQIIEECGQPIDYVVNTLVRYLYVMKPNNSKKVLWGCFGGEIVENLKANTSRLGRICKVCGKRYSPNASRQVTCSEECSIELNRQETRRRKSEKV